MMVSQLYQKRFTIFLFSFLLMLFGDIFVSKNWETELENLLILQNMLISYLLFLHSDKLKKLVIGVLIFFGIASRFYQQTSDDTSTIFFVFTYLLYFLLVSYQLFNVLLYQKVSGIETISAVFCGFILLGTAFSFAFVAMDHSFGAFQKPVGSGGFTDFLYFSFITLLTIGYGDIIPVTEISKKAIILLGLLGHFYTVFVMAIVIGKFLRQETINESEY